MHAGAHGQPPLGVSLLPAAVLGVLLVVIPGTARIIQLHITARRRRRLDTKPPASPAATCATLSESLNRRSVALTTIAIPGAQAA